MGLGLGKDGGWATRGETRSGVPRTPASLDARAGAGGEAGVAPLPCCSLSTQVLHRRRPGRTGVAWAAAAFKYRPGPRVPTASLVALGDSQLGLRSFSPGVEVGFRPEPGAQ